MGSKGLLLSIVSHSIDFLTWKIAVMHWLEPKSYNKPFELLHSWDFGLGTNDLVTGTPFAKAGSLQ